MKNGDLKAFVLCDARKLSSKIIKIIQQKSNEHAGKQAGRYVGREMVLNIIQQNTLYFVNC